jgi:hypothetical protein
MQATKIDFKSKRLTTSSMQHYEFLKKDMLKEAEEGVVVWLRRVRTKCSSHTFKNNANHKRSHGG